MTGNEQAATRDGAATWVRYAWLAAIACLVAIAFAPGLDGDFIFDDFSNIVFNDKVHAESLDAASIAKAADAYSGPIGRPLATIGFAIDYHLGDGSPRIFKIHNLAVHLLNTVLVYVFLRGLMQLAGARSGWRWWAPAAVSAAWAVHPLQVSTVLYVVQRMEMLSATFVLGGLICYINARRAQMSGNRGLAWLAAALLLPTAGLLAKESAALFPLYYLLLELTLLKGKATNPRHEKLLRAAFAIVLSLGALVFFLLVLPRFGSAADFAIRDFSMVERLLTQARVLPMHLGQLVLPAPSNMPFYYDDMVASTGLLSPPSTLAGLVLLVLLCVAAWFGRRRAPLFALGVAFFLAAHALTSSPIALELAFEHRNYLASLGLVTAIAALLPLVPTGENARSGAVITIVLVGLLGGITAIRSATWGDPLVLAMELVALNPDSARASNDLGATYVRFAGNDPSSPFLDLALSEFERGSALGGSSALAEHGLLLTAAMAGRPAKDAWWDALDRKLREQPAGPELRSAMTGLLAQHKQGIRVDAERLAISYQILLDRRPDWPGFMYATFGQFVLDDLHDVPRAKDLFVKAVLADPNDKAFADQVLGSLLRREEVEITEAVAHAMIDHGLLEEGAPLPGSGPAAAPVEAPRDDE